MLPSVHLWYPAQIDLPGGGESFPLLIYYPGWQGMEIENHALIGNLASHGYVVAGVTYPLKTREMSADDFTRLVRHLDEPMDHSSEAAYRRTVRIATSRVERRARDAIAIVDELARRRDADEAFARRLDFDRVGIFGFSLGGAVAAEAATYDRRFRAAVNIDGRHWGRALETGVSQPYLFIGQELRQPGAAQLESMDAEIRYNALLNRYDYAQLAAHMRRHGGTHVTVMGAEHLSFTDRPRRTRLRRLLRHGRISAKQAAHILNVYTLAFFEQTLRAVPSDLLASGATPLKRTRIEVWTAQTAGGVQIS